MDSQNLTEKELAEFIKNNTATLYNTTASDIGQGATEKALDKNYGINGLFTKHLVSSGMYKFNGLNTVKDKERVINGSKDWMLNLV